MARKVLVNDVVNATVAVHHRHGAESRAYLNQFNIQPFLTKKTLVGGDV